MCVGTSSAQPASGLQAGPVPGARGLLESVSHTGSGLVPALREEPQAHQTGKGGRATTTESGQGWTQGWGCRGAWENALSQLRQLIQKGFLEQAVLEVGLHKSRD